MKKRKKKRRKTGRNRMKKECENDEVTDIAGKGPREREIVEVEERETRNGRIKMCGVLMFVLA